MNWRVIPESLPFLLRGLLITLQVTLISGVLAFAVGLIIAQLRLVKWRAVKALAFAYTQVFRALSLYVYVLLVFFGVAALLRVEISPFSTAIICLTLLYSTYFAEILRGGFLASDRGQIEAGVGLGMTRVSVFFRIELIQVIRSTFPAMTATYVDMVKDSAILSLVGATDLMFRARQLVATTQRGFEVYTATALIYVAIVLVVSRGASWIEMRTKW